MKTIELKYGTVTYDDSQEAMQAVFDRVLKYYFEHESFCGESICQSDNPIIDAPNAMAEIADNILKFDVDYGDD